MVGAAMVVTVASSRSIASATRTTPSRAHISAADRMGSATAGGEVSVIGDMTSTPVLDAGPASLYVYVNNTGDLHAQILDALLGPLVAAAPASGPWRDRLKALLTSYLRLLGDYPQIARMVMSTQPSGPNYMALAEAVLA